MSAIDRVDVAVVGGGICGLALAHGLRQAGTDCVLLERAPEVGGTLRTLERDGFLLETGANTFLDRERATWRLLSALGLDGQVRVAEAAAHHRYLWTRGKLHRLPTSLPGLVTSGVLSATGKLRLLAEPLSTRAPGADESLAAMARRHLGREATEVLVDALQAGIFAGDVERLSGPAVFPKLAELEQKHRSWVLGMIHERKAARARAGTAPTSERGTTGAMCSLQGGLGTLTRALGQALGPRVWTQTHVERIEPAADGGYRVTATRGAGTEQRSSEADRFELWAQRLALATPAPVSSRLLAALDPGLSALVGEIPYAPVAAVHLAFPASAARWVPPAFGFLAPSREGLDVLGVLFISSTFPWRAPEGRVLLTAMVGGARRPELLDLDDAALSAKVREALARVLGLCDEPSFVHIVRWPQAIPQYTVGHQARVARIDQALAKHPGLHLLGNAYRGVGLNDCIRDAESMARHMSRSS